jgi:PhoH-like ATPase
MSARRFDSPIARRDHRGVAVKNYVLDTNVLLHDARAIFAFADNNVVIPIYVIEEIDTFKKDQTELGRNARQVARLLDAHRVDGGLSKPQQLDNGSGGTVRVALAKSPPKNPSYDSRSMDQRILEIAIEVQDSDPATPTILVTKDVNMRIRGDALGLTAVDYDTERVTIEDLYPGHREVGASAGQIDALYADGGTAVTVDGGLYANEFVLLKDETTGKSALARNDKASGKVVPVKKLREGVWGIRPRNKEQHYALDLLLNDDIKLVTLVGKAGTGKTLLALAAGLQKVTEEDIYSKLLVSRPIFPLGRDIGYLPGDIEEKLNPWMQPIYDNLELLLGLNRSDKKEGRSYDELVDLGLRPGRAADLHPRPVVAQRVHDRRRGAEPDAARGQDHHHARRRGHEDHPDRRPVPDRSPVPRLVEQRPDHGGRALQAGGIAGHITLAKGERSQLAELATQVL